MYFLQRTTGKTVYARGIFTINGKRRAINLSRIPIPERVSWGYYTINYIKAINPAKTTYDDETGVAVVTQVSEPIDPPAGPDTEVIDAARELQDVADKLNAIYPTLALDISVGYRTLRQLIFSDTSPVPAGLRGDVCSELHLAYSELDYCVQQSNGACTTWNDFPEIVTYLTTSNN